MTRNRFIVGVVLATVAAALAAADTLYLRDGEQHPGALKKMSVDRVWFETPEGVLEYPKTDVLKVQLQRARQYDEVETVGQTRLLRSCRISGHGGASWCPGGSMGSVITVFPRAGGVQDQTAMQRFTQIIDDVRGPASANSITGGYQL